MRLMNTPQSILEFLMKFCEIRSVTDSPGELEAAAFLHRELSQLPYYQEHPEDLFLQKITGDRLGRNNLVAWVKAKKPTKKTIILMGHFDVVDTDVCGLFSEDAFFPKRYTELLLQEGTIPEHVQEDLKSGEWISGRGVMDMKCGLAVQAALLAEMSEKTDELDANLVYLAVADEENNAAGIGQAIQDVAEWKKQGFEFICCIDSEPTITQDEKDKGWIHLGSIGMYTPFTFVLGRETHVGEYDEGLPASLIAFKLGSILEGNRVFADEYKGFHYPPLTCLHVKDLKPTYSVTVIERIAMYHNVLFVTQTPKEVLEKLKLAAEQAMEAALSDHKQFVGEVWDYQTLMEVVEQKLGRDIEEISRGFLGSLPATLELQDRGLRLVNYLIDLADIKGPKVIVGFLPPYCPAHYNERRSPEELAIIHSVEQLIAESKARFGTNIGIGEIYEGISDLSEFNFKGSNEDIAVLSNNFPGWGHDFDYPFERSKALNIPVINIGPIGKDAHKKTERLYLPYALNTLPYLLKEAVRLISQH